MYTQRQAFSLLSEAAERSSNWLWAEKKRTPTGLQNDPQRGGENGRGGGGAHRGRQVLPSSPLEVSRAKEGGCPPDDPDEVIPLLTIQDIRKAPIIPSPMNSTLFLACK